MRAHVNASCGNVTRQPVRAGLLACPTGTARRLAANSFLNDAFKKAFKLDKGDQDATFAPLDVSSEGGIGGTSDDVFGPLAVLLVGFQETDFAAFQQLMNDMEADMVPLYCADGVAMRRSLQSALEEGKPGFQPAPLGTRRAVILSGMYTAEVVDIVSMYREEGLPPAVFAAAVPRNYGSQVAALVDEIYSDDAAAKKRDAQRRTS